MLTNFYSLPLLWFYSLSSLLISQPIDCIWENISIPSRQISMRRTIADGTLIVGAVFWSIVVVRFLWSVLSLIFTVFMISLSSMSILIHLLFFYLLLFLSIYLIHICFFPSFWSLILFLYKSLSHTHTHTHTHANTDTHTDTHTFTHTQTQTHTHKLSHTHTLIPKGLLQEPSLISLVSLLISINPSSFPLLFFLSIYYRAS